MTQDNFVIFNSQTNLRYG